MAKQQNSNPPPNEGDVILGTQLQPTNFSPPPAAPAAPVEKIRVKARNRIVCDDMVFQEGQEGEITERQYRALGRHFARVVALILMLIVFATAAQAQTYTLKPIAGLTNGVIIGGSTSNYWVPLTNYTFLTNISVYISNGIPVFSSNVVTNASVTIPGQIPLTKNSQVAVSVTLNGGPGTTTNSFSFPFFWNLDGTTNGWPAFTLSGYASNTVPVTVGTNFTVGAAGYLILMSGTSPGTNYLTNAIVQYSIKPGLLGL